MCRAVTCRTCKKTTWAGCGQHVAEVMKDVPKAKRCVCDRSSTKKAPKPGGLFSNLFSRRSGG